MASFGANSYGTAPGWPVSYAVMVIVHRDRRIEAASSNPMALYATGTVDYGKINFRKQASLFQKVFSYVYIGSMLFLLLVSFPVFQLCDL